MEHAIEALPLIRTKLHRPRLPGDLILRRRLLDRLHAGLDRKLTLISAMAGTGKTTLLVQWLEECPQPSAWLSLDEHDNDRIVFLSYLCSAIQTVFPSACEDTLSLLSAPEPPSARAITTSILNELDELAASLPQQGDRSSQGLILALDDYQYITEPTIHEILSSVIEHMTPGIHLALATRADPQLPLARLRARREMTEIRSADLRFTLEEAGAFLERTTGREISPETIRLLDDKTEGWVVGLRLAGLSARQVSDEQAFVRKFERAESEMIVDYLVSEVLAQQPADIRDFALRTSILDRFCAPLYEALTEVSAARSQEIIEFMLRANLLVKSLDEEGRWYRYHHLFREILRHRLRRQYSADDIAKLHTRAGNWFAQNGLVDEALHHFLAGRDAESAVALVARLRYDLLNQAQWARLHRYLHEFSPEVVDRSPELLMLKTWLLYHRGRYGELATAVRRVEAALAHTNLAPRPSVSLQGEISAIHSYVSYFAVDAANTIAHARKALEKVPRELWIVRVLARLCLGAALQMKGDYGAALAALYSGFEEDETGDSRLKATVLMTSCNIYYVAGDLQNVEQAADMCIQLSQDPYSPQIEGFGHYHLGRVRYHQNDLASAEEHFASVVERPYRNYGLCYVYSACGLALAQQAQGQADAARELAESAVAFMLETGNTTLYPVAEAFRAELALMQGQVATASQWAAGLDPIPPLTPIFGIFSPHLTLVKAWLAMNTPVTRGKARSLLDKLQRFCESTHNIRFLLEVLALQALLCKAEGDDPSALTALEQAIELAEPGGFIRPFVELGPPMDRLLESLHQRGVAPDYVAQILAAFPPSRSVGQGIRELIEPLTATERRVLALLGRHLTNKEIADQLVVSPSTVKTHTLNIYRKLDVHGRKQAVARARELSILPPRPDVS
jgi:LuxR family maltose regulon positive regulatory protein